jgi:nicotinate phosphoribosyltransferase
VDEYQIHKWEKENLPIDGYGVGTKYVTSADKPYLDIAYKLVEYEGKPKFKLSEGKKTYPFKKQVYRFYNSQGKMEKDKITQYGKKLEGQPLVRLVMEKGNLLKEPEDWKIARERFLEDFSRLPEELKTIEKHHYRVEIDEMLHPERFLK